MELDSVKLQNSDLNKQLQDLKLQLKGREVSNNTAESLQKTVAFFKDETAKAQAESHLLKLELEKHKRIIEEEKTQLSDLKSMYTEQQQKMEKQKSQLKDFKAKLTAAASQNQTKPSNLTSDMGENKVAIA